MAHSLPKGHEAGNAKTTNSDLDKPQVANIVSEPSDPTMAKGGSKVNLVKGHNSDKGSYRK